jgi:hypothetical protein
MSRGIEPTRPEHTANAARPATFVAHQQKTVATTGLARQSTRGGFHSALHRDHPATPDPRPSLVNALHPVAVIGTEATPWNHLHQTPDNRGIRLPHRLARPHPRTGAGLDAHGEDKRAQDADCRRK